MIHHNEILFKPFSFKGELEPLQKLGLAYSSNDGNIQHGLWESGPGELELEFGWYETVYVLEGKAFVENVHTNEVFLLVPGSLMTFEKGTKWKWRIPFKFKKNFTIVDI